MYLTVHTAVGAVIGQHSPTLSLAFILGFLSHFILDMIPHGDERWGFEEWSNNKEKLKKIIGITALDVSLAITFIVFLFLKNNFTHPSFVAASLIGSIIPDAFVGCYILISQRDFFKKFYHLHYLNHHRLLGSIKLPFFIGMIIQLLIFWWAV